MKQITLGKTGICVPQNGFGALPIQRVSLGKAVDLLRNAYQGGMRFFDTARAYSDSEEKIGAAFGNGWLDRSDVILTTKTAAKTPEQFWKDLETSLQNLKTDYIDVYQFHLMQQCWKPGDGTGMYECMVEAKKQGKIRHIGGTAHKLGIARELAESGLYETVQYPISYLASEKELDLIRLCQRENVGFICMKGLAGGLITNSKAAMAFVNQFDGTVPIWGIQRQKELDEWLSYMHDTPVMDQGNYRFYPEGTKGTARGILPWLRILHAMYSRYPDQSMQPDVFDAAPGPKPGMAQRILAEGNGKDRYMH